MVRALIWKELREHLWTVLALCLCLVVLKPSLPHLAPEPWLLGQQNHDIAGRLVRTLLAIYAVLLGAHTFGYERSRGTLAYLLTRPVDRRVVVGVKIFVSVLLLVVGGAISTLAINDTRGFGWDHTTIRVLKASLPHFSALVLLTECATVVSCFGGTVAASLVGGSALCLVLVVVFKVLSLGHEAGVPTCLLSALGLSLITMRVQQNAPFSGWRKKAWLTAKTMVPAVALVGAGLFVWNLYLTLFPGPMGAEIVRVAPEGLYVTGWTLRPPLGCLSQCRSYRVDWEGTATRWLKFRNVRVLSVSPDGRYLLAEDFRGLLGFGELRNDVVVLRSDGTECHRISGRERFIDFAWGSSGSKLAFYARQLLWWTGPYQNSMTSNAMLLPFEFDPYDGPRFELRVLTLSSGEVVSVPFEPSVGDREAFSRILSFDDRANTLRLQLHVPSLESMPIVKIGLNGKVIEERTSPKNSVVLPADWFEIESSRNRDWMVLKRQKGPQKAWPFSLGTYKLSLALVHKPSSNETQTVTVSSPDPKDVFFETVIDTEAENLADGRLPNEPQVFWSERYGAFLILTDWTKVQSISPQDRILKERFTIRF